MKTVTVTFAKGEVLSEQTDIARELYNRYSFGSITKEKRVQFSLIEALYLARKKKIHLVDGRGKDVDLDAFEKKAAKVESNFFARYCVFRDFRDRGYVIKTALKFGADFRVYDRGIKPGDDHARWIVYPVKETEGMTWYDFSAKNRVAHSTKKRLMVGVVDDEGDVTYYEIKWTRP